MLHGIRRLLFSIPLRSLFNNNSGRNNSNIGRTGTTNRGLSHPVIRIMRSIRNYLSTAISQLTVEPIVFLNFFALSFFHISQHATLYRSICLQNYQSQDPTIDCTHLGSNGRPELEDRVQEDASTWSMFLSMSYLFPSVASDIVMGAWSDRHGRKDNILIGLTGLIVSCVAQIALAVFPRMNLYVVCASNALAGAGGGVAIVMISSYSYITDVVESKKELTTRMLLVQVYRYVADVIGSISFSIISRYANLATTLLIAQSFFVAAFFYALLRLYQLPPRELRQLISAIREKQRKKTPNLVSSTTAAAVAAAKYGMETKNGSIISSRVKFDRMVDNVDIICGDESQNRDSSATSASPTNLQNIITPAAPEPQQEEELKVKGGLCGQIYRLYTGVWDTIARPRPGNKRTYILLCSALYLAYIMSEIGLQGSIFSLYVFHRPFFWSPSQLGQYRGIQNLCSFLVNLLGVFLVDGYVRADDTSIMIFGVGTGVIHLILVGLARDTYALYAAAIFAAFGSLLIPSLKSFMVRIVDEHEVGRTLAANGIAADFAFVGSTLIFTNLYTYTVSTYASTVFFVGAAVLLVCFFVTIWIKMDSRKTGQNDESNLIRTA